MIFVLYFKVKGKQYVKSFKKCPTPKMPNGMCENAAQPILKSA